MDGYDPVRAGLPLDLTHHLGPPVPVARIDPLVRRAIPLMAIERADLAAFVRDALTDARVAPASLCTLVPTSVPSGSAVLTFEGCQ